ncbi:MAG TPA: translocation/assembly module TamB domain-containing protein [Burkholderiales bacterium]|nr:translocation/assembly module TamB domain-containing protein [Burkholderiales bacterium]
MVALGGFVAWLFATESGLQWALNRAVLQAGGKLVVDGARGTLASVVMIERLRFDADGTTLELRDVAGHGHLASALGGRIVIEPLRVASVDVKLGPDPGKPPTLPTLPFGIRIGQVEIGRLTLEQDGTAYAFRNLRFAHIAIGALPPSSISAEGSFEFEHERYPVTGTLALGGTLERLQAHVAGKAAGGIPADVRAVVTPLAPQKIESVEARAGPVDLATLDADLPHTALDVIVKATGFAGTLSATNGLAGPIDRQRLPIAGLQTRFSTDLQKVTLENLHIALAGGGTLDGRGVASAAGFDGKLKATQLNLRALRSTLRETHLSGPLELSLALDVQTIRGTLSQPGMTVTADAVRKGNDVDIRKLHASAEGGEVTGTGKLRLGEPLAFDAKLALARFNPAAFGDYPQGAISGNVIAKGQFGKELAADLQWALTDSNLLEQKFETRGSARVAGRRVLQAQADAKLAGSKATVRGSFGAPGDRLSWALEVTDLHDHVADVGGRVKAEGTLGGTFESPDAALSARFQDLELPRGIKLSSASAELAGTLARHAGQFVVRIEGTDVQARLRGGLAGRQWTGEIQALEGNGKVPFLLREPAPLKASPERVELGTLSASLGDGRLLVRELMWSKERVSSSGEFTGLPAQWIVTAARLGEKVRSTLLLDGQWQIAAAPNLDGNLRLRRAGGDITIVDETAVELGLESIALDARFTNAGVGARLDVVSRFATAAVAGQLGRDPAAGVLGIGPKSALSAQGQVELAHARLLAQPWLADARFDGRVGADLQASGTLGTPVFTGTLRGDALAFDYPPMGVYLKNGQFRAKIESDVLRLDSFSVQAGEGTLTASGTLPFRVTQGNAKLTWQARNFALLERPDTRLVTSGEGEAGFDGKRLSFSGELRADRGHLEIETQRMPKLSNDVVIAGQTRPIVRDTTNLPVQLNLDLELGDNLTVLMQGLEGKLTGRVNVTTAKDGELRAYGRLSTLNATFFAYGQKLQVDPGVLIFDGPLDNPALQITAWRRNQAVEVGVQISGTVRAPRVQLVSQPAVSEGERLSWLVLGRAPTDATKADLGLLQAAAGALLARGDSMPLDRRLARSFGLDEVSFRGTGEVQDRVLAFGKRLSDKLYVSYEQGLGTVASNLVKLDYALSRRWSVRAETGTSSGLSLFYRFSWE